VLALQGFQRQPLPGSGHLTAFFPEKPLEEVLGLLLGVGNAD